MDARTQRNFILQQGFDDPPARSCAPQHSALLFQPRVILLIVVIGIVLQAPLVFLSLSAVLWWSALLPCWNPFDAVYNATLAGRWRLRRPPTADRQPETGARPGWVRLTPAPAPRRFAQGMAATFTLAIGTFLLLGWRLAAYVMEGVLLVAVIALALGSICLGSFVFHLLRGRVGFARRTLPWAREESA